MSNYEINFPRDKRRRVFRKSCNGRNDNHVEKSTNPENKTAQNLENCTNALTKSENSRENDKTFDLQACSQETLRN